MNQTANRDLLARGKSAGFDQPFEMMEACHERVQRMVKLIHKLLAHVPQHGYDDQAQQAARDIMRYFDNAAPQHHRDEELHVFPALVGQADDATVEVVARLQQDHLQMEAGWKRARQILDAIAQGTLAAIDDEQYAQLEGFAALYEGHIEAEEKIAYPAARVLLDEAAQKAMGEEMQRRRGA